MHRQAIRISRSKQIRRLAISPAPVATASFPVPLPEQRRESGFLSLAAAEFRRTNRDAAERFELDGDVEGLVLQDDDAVHDIRNMHLTADLIGHHTVSPGGRREHYAAECNSDFRDGDRAMESEYGILLEEA